MTNILAFCEDTNDGTSFYRAVPPLSALQKEYNGLLVDYLSPRNEMPDWSTLIHYEWLFLQRPSSEYAYILCVKAIQMGLKIWIDYDDWLLGVPPENPCHELYNSTATRNRIIHLLSQKSVRLTVSTPFLGELFKRETGKEYTVIPNALNVKLLGLPQPLVVSNNTVSWRGSSTHEKDLYIYQDEIHRSFESVEYIGFMPKWGTFRKDKDIFTPPESIIEYYIKILKRRNRKFFFVCLEDNDFNRAKSNIAAIEAVWAGAVVLAPDWEEWNIPGLVNYTGKENFVWVAKEMMEMSDEEHKRLWLQSSQYILKNYELKEINKKRYEIIC